VGTDHQGHAREGDIPSGLADRLQEQGLALLNMSAGHAEAIRDFPELLRRDPFDRLIMAQALVTGARLITAA